MGCAWISAHAFVAQAPVECWPPDHAATSPGATSTDLRAAGGHRWRPTSGCLVGLRQNLLLVLGGEPPALRFGHHFRVWEDSGCQIGFGCAHRCTPFGLASLGL